MIVTNRIRELREAAGLSMEKLGERIGASTSTINRLEKGGTDLISEWLPPLARELGVRWWELIEIDDAPAAPGLAEEASLFVPEPGHPLARFGRGPTADLWTVGTDALDAIGIHRGDIVVVDIGAVAVAGVTNGDAVVVQLMDPADPARATTLVRQFIEPDLLITNSRTRNERMLNRRIDDVRIKGVIVSRFAPVGRRSSD